MSIELRVNKTCIRTNEASVRHVLVTLRAPAASGEITRSPASVAFVIDRSGSMSGRKLALAREAVIQAIRRLLPQDRFAVVAYDDEVAVIFESSLCTEDTRHAASRRVAAIGAPPPRPAALGPAREKRSVRRSPERSPHRS